MRVSRSIELSYRNPPDVVRKGRYDRVRRILRSFFAWSDNRLDSSPFVSLATDWFLLPAKSSADSSLVKQVIRIENGPVSLFQQYCVAEYTQPNVSRARRRLEQVYCTVSPGSRPAFECVSLVLEIEIPTRWRSIGLVNDVNLPRWEALRSVAEHRWSDKIRTSRRSTVRRWTTHLVESQVEWREHLVVHDAIWPWSDVPSKDCRSRMILPSWKSLTFRFSKVDR